MNPEAILLNDTAITHKDQDIFNYYPFAQKVQRIIQGYANNPSPLTIGIYGKWGMGKTSMLQLIEKHIELFDNKELSTAKKYIKFHYNPWLYQSKEEMLFDFFDTLSLKVTYAKDDQLKKAGAFILKYSRYLKAVKLSVSGGIPNTANAGLSVEPYEILKALGEDLQGAPKGLSEIKKEIDLSLARSDKKIIIFIDDVDRLDRDEMFTLFKLIKIGADFSNLVFVICMDDHQVAQAIQSRYGNELNAGKAFLEKIINVPLQLPLIEKDDLHLFLKKKIDPILKQGKIKDTHLNELYKSLESIQFDTPREIVRILNSFAVSFFAIGQEVHIHDLFWIEYLKIKHQNVYQELRDYTNQLNDYHKLNPRITLNDTYNIDQKEEPTGIRKTITETYPKVLPIIDMLFPTEKQAYPNLYSFKKHFALEVLQSELRVSHIDHFEKYFSYHTYNKVSELKFCVLENHIEQNQLDQALIILNQLFTDGNEYKLTNRIRSYITAIDEEHLKSLTIFLVDHLHLFKENGFRSTNAISLLESIAVRIKETDLAKHKEACKYVIKTIATDQSIYFLDTIRYKQKNVPVLKDLDRLFINQIKNNKGTSVFFSDRGFSIIIMQIWVHLDSKAFKFYIYQSFKHQENIILFLRSFLHFWNEAIWSPFRRKHYERICREFKLDTTTLYRQIQKFYPDIQASTYDPDLMDEYVTSSEQETISQFIYWYLEQEDK